MAAKKQTRRVTKEEAWKGLREKMLKEHAQRVRRGVTEDNADALQRRHGAVGEPMLPRDEGELY